MKTRLTLFTATLSAAMLVLPGCGKPPTPPQAAPSTPQVEVLTLAPQRLPITAELPGRTQPVLTAEVRPQVGGLVKSRLFKEGSDVKAGDVLYQVDAATYAANVDSNNAALARADAALGSAKLKAARAAELASIKAGSQQDADDAEAALKQAQADVLSSRAAVQTARIDLDRTRITAPIAGRIGRSSVTPGALVTANQATALATVQKIDPMLVDLTQSSNVVMQLKRMQGEGTVHAGDAKVKLVLGDGTAYPLEGKLQFTEVNVDQGTGNVTLRAEFPNPKGTLLPGLYVRAVIEAGVVDDALLLPQQAVTRDTAGNATAFVVGADNKLAVRKIVAPRAFGNQWIVTEGLKAGDRVAVRGQEKAKPGTVVQTKAYENTADATGDAEGEPGTAPAPRTAAAKLAAN